MSDLIAFLTSPTNCDDPVHARKDTTAPAARQCGKSQALFSWFREQVGSTLLLRLPDNVERAKPYSVGSEDKLVKRTSPANCDDPPLLKPLIWIGV